MTKRSMCFHLLWPNTDGRSCPTAGSDMSIYDLYKPQYSVATSNTGKGKWEQSWNFSITPRTFCHERNKWLLFQMEPIKFHPPHPHTHTQQAVVLRIAFGHNIIANHCVYITQL
jgi:hypothetical protein